MKSYCGVGIILLAIACGTQSGERWMTVAESLTSLQGPAPVQYRLFSAPELGELCAQLRPHMLEGPPGSLTLILGKPFLLETIQVLAVDSEGRRLDKVPLMIDVATGDPEMFERVTLQNDPGVLTPVRTGQFRIRIRGVCDDSPEELYLVAVVIATIE